jgi:hypothetical protein
VIAPEVADPGTGFERMPVEAATNDEKHEQRLDADCLAERGSVGEKSIRSF